ncbi:MAG: YraN family protein [Candidatus Aenigmarchaeota archaeon]|nr:YraN family protein [Candidatus Aenigmarchaeota archaeon]
MILNRRKLGNIGEDIAVQYLKKKHYKILERNFYSCFGEIDIIARKKKIIIFVEVKSKQDDRFGLPEEEFTYYKKRKIYRTIQIWLKQYHITDQHWQVDLIAIDQYLSQPEIYHYRAVSLA